MIKVVAVYILIGVVVELFEEWLIVRKSEKWFGVKCKERVVDRFVDYDISAFLRDISDVILWPFGILWVWLGIKKVKENHVNIEELVKRYDKTK